MSGPRVGRSDSALSASSAPGCACSISRSASGECGGRLVRGAASAATSIQAIHGYFRGPRERTRFRLQGLSSAPQGSPSAKRRRTGRSHGHTPRRGRLWRERACGEAGRRGRAGSWALRIAPLTHARPAGPRRVENCARGRASWDRVGIRRGAAPVPRRTGDKGAVAARRAALPRPLRRGPLPAPARPFVWPCAHQGRTARPQECQRLFGVIQKAYRRHKATLRGAKNSADAPSRSKRSLQLDGPDASAPGARVRPPDPVASAHPARSQRRPR